MYLMIMHLMFNDLHSLSFRLFSMMQLSSVPSVVINEQSSVKSQNWCLIERNSADVRNLLLAVFMSSMLNHLNHF